ncbi:biotin synthase BioB [Tundrisphaera lichenicola]|uniref:biotin synthase BioB n=1 Tax=Tundrisphaera lichenicola TaxID=2029860 RepID=UPI003EC01E29
MSEMSSRPTLDDVAAIYRSPVLDLVFRAAEVHRAHHDPSEVQVCVLQSIKTGGCPEDCGYCPQAARYHTSVEAEPLMDVEAVLAAARRAKESGAARFCMGAAWREVKDNRQFDRVLEMIRGVKELGLEACATLGMVNEDQARRMKEAGLDAYNHNLDTSEAYYDRIIQTRTYQDRLNTLASVRNAGITVCCGGIVGMGESDDDRIALLHTLANLPEPPESVPINALVAVEGTPLADRPNVSIWDMVRTIATARILMPGSMVRLSAGRLGMSESDQALCFLAGANSIFAGDKLLTTPNPGTDRDQILFDHLGLVPKPAASAGVHVP